MAPPDGVNTVYLQIQFNQINKVDGVEQSYGCDFYMRTHWQAIKANKNISMAEQLELDVDFGEYWNPDLEFIK
jgi:hypothetical protein